MVPFKSILNHPPLFTYSDRRFGTSIHMEVPPFMMWPCGWYQIEIYWATLSTLNLFEYKAWIFWGTRQCPTTHWQLRKQVCAYTISWRDWHKQFTRTNIRLENVCFNKQYEPVLIDLDWSIKITRSPVIYGKSCMFMTAGEMTPDQIDWIQGLLAAWVKMTTTRENFKTSLKPFISKLINEGR